MTKSRKSKILALALCAGVMSGIYASPALAARGDYDFNYKNETNQTSGLKNPEIHHTEDNGQWVGGPIFGHYEENWEPVHPDQIGGDEECEVEVADSNVTVGDINKVVGDLVDNDEMINSKVESLKEQVNNIQTTTDTHVKEGAATVAENGDVTMDIVDKDGNDTGKDVTITGLASDSELAAVDEKAEQAGKDAAAAQSTANEALTAAGTAQATAEKAQAAAEGAVVIAEEGDKQLQANIDAEADERRDADDKLATEISEEHRVNGEQNETLADHQEQLDDHSQQLDEVRGDVGGLIANDAVQDETLADHQEQLDDHSQQLDEVRGEAMLAA